MPKAMWEENVSQKDVKSFDVYKMVIEIDMF